jgi:phospholipid/cholesterol/gamma-HCH transport system permease protein
MPLELPSYELLNTETGAAVLAFKGDWSLDSGCPDFTDLQHQLEQLKPKQLVFDLEQLNQWDSALPTFLYQLDLFCEQRAIEVDDQGVPAGILKLSQLASAVPPHIKPAVSAPSLLERISPLKKLSSIYSNTEHSLEFIGEVSVAMWRLVTGRANTRRVDFVNFIYQAGPSAFGIITLTSFLVGMILAYLGAAQLAQFGAQVYVADLVTVGMLREMGALMTAIVMAGRTGAAYAAQLGTMQTNEEIDAIVTLGISPVEFLVLPRMIALIVIMPLLVLYSNVIGILGGSIVAAGMGVSFIQVGVQFEEVFTPMLLSIGLIKSVFFATLIAIAGCRAGMKCGRSSAAVGEAATNAVVVALVYLIVADASFNILFQKLGI